MELTNSFTVGRHAWQQQDRVASKLRGKRGGAASSGSNARDLSRGQFSLPGTGSFNGDVQRQRSKLTTANAAKLAESRILQAGGKPNDDANFVVLRGARPNSSKNIAVMVAANKKRELQIAQKAQRAALRTAQSRTNAPSETSQAESQPQPHAFKRPKARAGADDVRAQLRQQLPRTVSVAAPAPAAPAPAEESDESDESDENEELEIV